MSINYYVGDEGPTIFIEDLEELYEAVDTLHTQVLDNLGGDRELLAILEEALDKLDGIKYDRNK